VLNEQRSLRQVASGRAVPLQPGLTTVSAPAAAPATTQKPEAIAPAKPDEAAKPEQLALLR
ncbi:MAG: lytic transglycosylase domain-containing protein, partial [Burkholderiaceae bacterium]